MEGQHRGRRGRPQIYRDAQESRRARAARLKASHSIGEQFAHTFLHYDPRIIPGQSNWHQSPWSHFDDIRDALRAIPAEHNPKPPRISLQRSSQELTQDVCTRRSSSSQHQRSPSSPALETVLAEDTVIHQIEEPNR